MREFLYGQINENNRLIAKSALSGKVDNPNMIVITEDEYNNLPFGSIYDRDLNRFTDPPPPSKLEILQTELNKIEAELRKEFDNYKFFTWLDMQSRNINNINHADNINTNESQESMTSIIFSEDHKTISDYNNALLQLVKTRQDILQKLEIVKNSEFETFSV